MSKALKTPEKCWKAPMCALCGDPVLPGQGWEACRGKRGGITYAHQKCLKKRSAEK